MTPRETSLNLIKQIDRMISALTKDSRIVESRITAFILNLIDEANIETDGKKILRSSKNIQAKNKMRRELWGMIRSDRTKSLISGSLETFAGRYDKIYSINNKYLNSALKDYSPSVSQRDLLATAKQQTLDSMTFGQYKNVLLNPIDRLLTQHINQGRDLTALKKQLREDIAGIKVVNGEDVRLKEGYLTSHYRTQLISREALHRFSRNYQFAVSENIGAAGVPKFFSYQGGIIKTSRRVCRKRVDIKFFSEARAESLMKKNKKEWPEKIKDLTIWEQCGGWNCRHTWLRVSIFAVPVNILEEELKLKFIKQADFDKVMSIRNAE